MRRLFLDELIEEQKSGVSKRNLQLESNIAVEIDKKADERFPDYTLLVKVPQDIYRFALTGENELDENSYDRAVRFAMANLGFAIRKDLDLVQKHRMLKSSVFNRNLFLNNPKDNLVKMLNLYTKRALAWKVLEFTGFSKAREFSQLLKDNKEDSRLFKQYQLVTSFYKKLPSIGEAQSKIMFDLMNDLFVRYKETNRRDLLGNSQSIDSQNYVPQLLEISGGGI
ncbi:MAG: hypothetical protein KC589_01625, partial [Nanoarchaeota archaeon]|nr:hypothetical protein [Nanoarchaeota archaeon]